MDGVTVGIRENSGGMDIDDGWLRILLVVLLASFPSSLYLIISYRFPNGVSLPDKSCKKLK